VDGQTDVKTIASRGAADNPTNRFEKVFLELDVDWSENEASGCYLVGIPVLP
jgi:hypothetical protein